MTSNTLQRVGRRAVDYVRTLDHLRAWRLMLPQTVKEVVITINNTNNNKHAGTKLFLYQNVPQLKYHNPSVKFSVEYKDDIETPQLTFVNDGGGCMGTVETTGLQWREIQHQINSLFTSNTI